MMTRPTSKPAKTPMNSRILWSIGIACLAWFALWFLTPGMLDPSPMRVFTANPDGQIMLESLVTLIASAVILYLTRHKATALLGWHGSQRWLYLIPLALGLSVPLHYHITGGYAPYVYVLWMTLSVFWQQYITFGLLQSYLNKRLGRRVAPVLTVIMFYLGHIALLPQFRPTSLAGLGGSVFILGLGTVFALLRNKTKSIRTNLLLHWAFYFIAC